MAYGRSYNQWGYNEYDYKRESEEGDRQLSNTMKSGDLNRNAFEAAYKAARTGDVAGLKAQMSGMTDRQKDWLLSQSFHPDDGSHAMFGRVGGIRGTPAEVAKENGHKELARFLRNEKEDIEDRRKEKEKSESSYRPW